MKRILLVLLIALITVYANAQIVVPLSLPDNCYVTVVNDLQSQTKIAAVKLFPNPTDDIFTLTIESPVLIGKIEISIYNAFGVKCFEIPAYCNSQIIVRQIAVDALPNGIYFLKVISENAKLNSNFIIQE